MKTRINLISFFLIPLFHILVALPFFGIWFLPDDFVSIYGSMQNPLKLLFSREDYALFNRWFFTPLLPISFKLDGHLFKLNPIGYHFHNYLVILMNAIVIYKIARFYLPGFYSLLSSLFFSFLSLHLSILGHFHGGTISGDVFSHSLAFIYTNALSRQILGSF